MQIIDRYIATSVVLSTLLVLLALSALFSFFTFFNELRELGKGHYTLLHIFVYVFLKLPLLVHQIFPPGALIGSVIGLGALAGHNELTVMRASGISLSRIVWSVIKIGIVLSIVSVFIGEWIAPLSETKAHVFRSVATSKKIYRQNKYGFWARDGNQFINVRSILPNGRLGNMYIYQYNEQRQLTKIIQAKEAFYDLRNWNLLSVTHTDFGSQKISIDFLEKEIWDTNLTPDLIRVVIVQPHTLSVVGLYRYMQYLSENDLDPGSYELAFWNKILTPFSIGAMLFLSVTFVFGMFRSATPGHRITIGVLVGISFYLFSQMLNYFALIFKLSPFLISIVPILIISCLAWMLMRKLA